MDKLIKWLENSFAPKLQKITNLTWVVVIKDSVMQLLPFILAGSIFCVGTILNDYIPALPSFWTPFGWTMSKIGLMASFLIPFNYCEKKRFRKQRILAGFTGMMLFMICIDPQSAEEMGQGHTLYGANGMFVAIFTGIIVGLVFGAFAKFSFFKEDSAIPDFVRQWFDSLLPIMLVIAGGWLIVQVAGVDVAGAVQAVFMPLQSALTSPVGFVFFCFLKCFIYSMGISTWVLTPVDEPVKLAVITANLELVAAGVATYQNLGIFTETFMFCTYLWIGGIGCTLSLCLLMMTICKSSELKALGRACIVPGIFNINEPIILRCHRLEPPVDAAYVDSGHHPSHCDLHLHEGHPVCPHPAHPVRPVVLPVPHQHLYRYAGQHHRRDLRHPDLCSLCRHLVPVREGL